MYSGYCHAESLFAYGAFTLSGWLSQNHSAKLFRSIMQSEPHGARTMVWALPRSLAATYGIDCFFLFLRLLRCFSSPGSPPYVMDWRMDTWGMLMWVSPFRHLRIKGYLLLPVAFRSLSRLSSALSAKASTLRSFLLDLVYSFYSVRNWVFAFNNADRIASILNFRSFGLVVNFVYDILGCLDKKSFSSKSSVWSFQGTIAFRAMALMH